MTSRQERALCDALQQPSILENTPDVPLDQIVKQLSALMPIRIDIRAIEEIGLTRDAPTNATIESRGTQAGVAAASPQRTAWWKRDTSNDLERPSVVVDLLTRLRELDMTLMIRRAHVVLTTVEAAEDDLATRIYDVTPLAKVDPHNETSPFAPMPASLGWNTLSEPAMLRQSRQQSGAAQLIQIIKTSIDCDTWEAWGGNSTIRPVKIRQRHWLVVSTLTTTHWKIQRLLDQLNRQ